MKLPVLLLTLSAIGQAVSKGTLQRTLTLNPTIKRELLEGNFGQKTNFFNNYGATEAAPGIQYADLKPKLQDSTGQHHQLFGARLPQISKISDLLTGQGPPFEVALTNHLYAPVSVYNARLPPSPLFEAAPATYNINQQTQTSAGEERRLHNLPTNQAPEQKPEYFSYSNSKYDSDIAAPNPLTVQFESNYNQQQSQKQNTFTGTPALTFFPSETKPSYSFSSTQAQNQPLQYQLQYIAAEPATKYKNRKAPHENTKAEKQVKDHNGPVNRPEEQKPLLVPLQAYHNHPNGAISFASFSNNQEASKQQDDHDFHQQQIHREELYQGIVQPNGNRLQLGADQQYSLFQPQQYQGQYEHQGQPQQVKTPHFIFPHTQQDQLYLNPVRQQLLGNFNQRPGPQALDFTQLSGPKLESTFSNTPSPQSYQTVPQFRPIPDATQFKFPDQAKYSTRTTASHHYTPTITTLEPYRTVTPTPQQALDQLLQPTTIQPEVLSEFPRDSQAQPRSINHKSKTAFTPQTTLKPIVPSADQSLHTISTLQPSSSTLQPEILSQAPQTYQGPHKLVHIQKQELQEIAAIPKVYPKKQSKTEKSHKHEYKIIETTPKPNPSKIMNSDYEIEIATDVDHSQLPKELQPVTTAKEELKQDFQANQNAALVEGTHQEPQPISHVTQQEQNPPQEQHIQTHAVSNLYDVDQYPVRLDQPSFGHNLPFYSPLLDNAGQIPHNFDNIQDVVQPDLEQTHIPAYPAVQYFGKFAESIFGDYQGQQ